MKLYRTTSLLSLLLVFTYLFVSSCKKKDDETTPTNTNNNTTTTAPVDSSHQTTRSTDATSLQSETSQAMDDANAAISAVSTTREITSICGLDSIDSTTTATTGLIVLYFDNSTNCGGKKKSGSIRINLPTSGGQVTSFSTQYTEATITFDNYKLTYMPSGNSITLGGSIIVKNLTGNAYLALLFGQPVIHATKMNVTAQFNEGGVITNATWKAKIKRTLTYTSGSNKLNISFAGDSTATINGISANLAFWGTNRYNEAYTIDMPSDFNYDITNDLTQCTLKPLGGQFNFRWSTHLLTLKYGIDTSTGNISTGCPNGYKLIWENSQGNQVFIVLPYVP